MLTLNLRSSAASIENYLNKKSKKGYHLKAIVPFTLFPPLSFTAFNFEKTSNRNRIYRVDTRVLEKDQEKEYYQLFADDGWVSLKNGYANSISNIHHIFYSDDSKKNMIYSEEESLKQRDRDNATYELIGGLFLFCVFICLSVFLPSMNDYPRTLLGFLSHYFYLIVAIGIIVISMFRYYRNKS